LASRSVPVTPQRGVPGNISHDYRSVQMELERAACGLSGRADGGFGRVLAGSPSPEKRTDK
jgi:hypothetical protein